MFEQYDLDISLPKSEYEREMPLLRDRLGVLQREFRDRGIPVIVIFEGWRVSGISGTINKLTYALDPRGYRVHSIQEPWDIERSHPLMWRFWVRTPAKGWMAIFDRSWYSRTLIEKFSLEDEPHYPPGSPDEIIDMEDQLADDGALIVKLFLHISKKEQKKRLEKLEKERPGIVSPPPGIHGKLSSYDKVLPHVEALIAKTDTANSPWTIVEAHDKRFTMVKVYQTIIRIMEDRLAAIGSAGTAPREASHPYPSRPGQPASHTLLQNIDLGQSLSPEEYEERKKTCHDRLKELQYAVYKKGISAVLVFEGWDAAGKGGAIIRLDQALNPRCSVVEPVGVPTEDELRHHYLWRFYQRFPAGGNITIFDRSWYGRVLVERVEQLVPEEAWRRAFHEINEMEESLVRNGTVVVKFWLQIDKDTQLRRFHEREADPLKKYKITEDDWRNREKWDEYEVAVNEMLQKTSTPHAPWTIVESNDKYFARIKIMETVIKTLEKELKH